MIFKNLNMMVRTPNRTPQSPFVSKAPESNFQLGKNICYWMLQGTSSSILLWFPPSLHFLKTWLSCLMTSLNQPIQKETSYLLWPHSLLQPLQTTQSPNSTNSASAVSPESIIPLHCHSHCSSPWPHLLTSTICVKITAHNRLPYPLVCSLFYQSPM